MRLMPQPLPTHLMHEPLASAAHCFFFSHAGPIGTYNSDAIDSDRQARCTPCPVGLTTQGTGSTNSSQCNLCAIGYGGYQCNTTCGGDISPTTAGSLYPGTVSKQRTIASLNAS